MYISSGDNQVSLARDGYLQGMGMFRGGSMSRGYVQEMGMSWLGYVQRGLGLSQGYPPPYSTDT